MGLLKRLRISGRPSSSSQPRSTQEDYRMKDLVPSSEVTEESLKVWRQLPGSIRHDPSMISFQQEHDRWKGK